MTICQNVFNRKNYLSMLEKRKVITGAKRGQKKADDERK